MSVSWRTMRRLSLHSVLALVLTMLSPSSAGAADSSPATSASAALPAAAVTPVASAAPAAPVDSAAAVQPSPSQAPKAAAASAGSHQSASAKKAPVKKRANTSSKTTQQSSRNAKKKTRAPGPQRQPEPSVRRAVAGVAAADESTRGAVESEELKQLEQAERDLFGLVDARAVIGRVPEVPPMQLLHPERPEVHVGGLPPPPSLWVGASEAPAVPLEWVRTLAQPDLPARWSLRVLQYLDFYKNDPRGRTVAAIWYRKSGRYEPMLRKVLRAHGLPEDLMWVSVVESGLNPTVYSSAGAAGLWQFMPATARLYGLVVDRWIDERLDPVRATHAAAMYLQDLQRRFGTWELALAAYNMGFGGLLASVRKYNTNDYWQLARYEAGIPWETTLYVPKIIALAIVCKNPASFGLQNLQRDPPETFDEVDVTPGVSVSSIAAAAQVDPADVEALNPQLLASRVPPRLPERSAAGVWQVRVPAGRGKLVEQNLVSARAREPRLQPYTVRVGETVGEVARVRGVSQQWLAEVNALRDDELVRAGTVLMVPEQQAEQGSSPGEKQVVVVPADIAPPAGQRRLFYRVIAGDTLAGVAGAFGVAADDVRRWNGLDALARLHEGMTLMVFVPSNRDVSHIVALGDDKVRVLVAGTEPFFAYHEGLRDRVRTTVRVGKGDSWGTVAKRTGLSVGMLERINRRSRSTELQPGEELVVYVPAGSVAARTAPEELVQQAKAASDDEPLELEPPSEAPVKPAAGAVEAAAAQGS